MDYIPMTQAGYNKKKAELDRMNNEEMPKIAERIAAARAEGDLKENAEYHGARESQGMLQAKINRQLHLRRTPQLVFQYDQSVEHGVRMTQLIDALDPGPEETSDDHEE